MELAGKVVLITGGGGGIGAGLAEAFAEKGARLVIADIAAGRAEAEAAKYGANALAIPIDVTSLDSWTAAREAALARFGQVDVLCNNAGISIDWELLADIEPEVFDSAMKINVYGVYNGVRTFAHDMIARGYGHICNTCSANGLVAPGMMATYSATKFAVKGMTDALRAELAPHGVTVSAVYPGRTRSFMSTAPKGRHEQAIMTKPMNFMEPVWVGRAIAAAVENGTKHVISHPDLKYAVEAVFDEVLADFGEPAQPGYKPYG
jgi:NAD(P)-dependent dehydrogenase (short-subunit alcohol dehydrogenase family)